MTENGKFLFSHRIFHFLRATLTMIIDENDILIHPRKGKKEKCLPEQAILIPNPAEAKVGAELFSRYSVEERFIYNSNLLVDKDERLCLAGPCLGAPAAGLVLEKLIVLGVKSVSVFSCCGSITEELSIGDLVIGLSGIAGEGVSAYYSDSGYIQPSERETSQLKRWLDQAGLVAREFGVWSTDAPYRESRAELERLRDHHGIACVDMEFTALCSIASMRSINLGGIFVVSDELWGRNWRPGFKRSDYRKRARSVLASLISYKIDGIGSDEKNV